MSHYKDTLTSNKRALEVVIFGPYAEGGHERLQLLRDSLRSKNYVKTDLVDLLPAPPSIAHQSGPIFATSKSEHYVRVSHVNLFVFFRDILHGSVTVEMKELFDNVKHKISCSSFFVQVGTRMETLELGSIRKYKCDYASFETDDDLHALAEKACLHHIIEDDCLPRIQAMLG
jgi:hypothetical protein